jgi:hypothetical protein
VVVLQTHRQETIQIFLLEVCHFHPVGYHVESLKDRQYLPEYERRIELYRQLGYNRDQHPVECHREYNL